MFRWGPFGCHLINRGLLGPFLRGTRSARINYIGMQAEISSK